MRRLFQKKIIVTACLIENVSDLLLTYVLLKNFPFVSELNPALNYLIRTFGLEWALLVVSPAFMALVFFLIYLFWRVAFVRWFAYFFLITNFFVVLWGLYTLYYNI